jgi:hypothetical protein
MNALLTGSVLESAIWLVVLLVAYLMWRGLSLRESLWPPLEGLAWAVGLSAVLAAPLSFLFPRQMGPFEAAWQTVARWVILVVVPVHVWKKLPAALLPKVTLSELIFWNVTVTGMSFAAWAGERTKDPASQGHWFPVLFWGFASLIWLWPTGLAVLLKSFPGRIVGLLRIPLILYFWTSLLYWLLGALLARESPTEGAWLFDFADSVFESFAAIQCFALIYFFYYAFNRDADLDVETESRVGDAIWNALEIDEWHAGFVLPAALLYGLAGHAATAAPRRPRSRAGKVPSLRRS